MSEAKRVAFTNITSSIDSSTGPPEYRTVGASSSLAVNKSTSQLFGNTSESETAIIDDGSDNNSSKTFRLELPLFQSNSNSYPEFNYSRLLQMEKKKMKKMKTRTNGFPDNVCENTNNDDDVARIASELEKKYGTSYGSGRSRNRKIDNSDKGLGYDESDSFIDNTEAYDEIIPEEVETMEGGFYINCGALEFKKLQTELTTTKTDEIIKMPNRPKKRILSSSSSEESSSSDEDDDGNEAIDDDDDEAEEDEAEDSSTNNKGQKSGNSSSTSVITIKNSKLFNKDGAKKGTTALSCSSSNSPKPVSEELNSDSEKAAPIKTTTVKDMLKAKRDTFLKAQVNDRKNSLNGQEKNASGKSSNDEDEDSSSSTGDSADSSDLAEQSNKKADQEPMTVASTTMNEENTEKVEIKLPNGLSKILLDKLQEFKEYALSKDMLNKKFQFDENLIKYFLEIYNILLTLDKTQRNLVFAHLEFHLQQPKYFFLRKAKQLRIKEEKVKNNRALGKLSRAIIEIMPTVIANYEVELRKCADLHAANVNLDQPPVMPKKEFSWNKSLRNLLYEVYEVRLNSFEVLRTRKESIEEFIINYMRSKVTEVWPNGWVQLEDLQREIEKCKISRSNKLNRDNKKNKNSITAANNNNNNNNVPSMASGIITSVTSANLVTQTMEHKKNQISSSNLLPTENANTFLSNQFALQQQEQQQSTSNKRKNSDSSGVLKSRKTKSQKKDNTNEIVNKKFEIPGANENNNLKPILNDLQQQNPFVINLLNKNDVPTTTTSTFNTFHQQQQQPPHSMHVSTTNNNNKNNMKSAHIIDLDNYKSAQDILKTSKQLLSAVQPPPPPPTTTTTAAAVVPKNVSNICNQHDSSSESDGVEIISVYHPQATTNSNNNIKYKHKNMDFQNAFSAHTANLHGTTTAAAAATTTNHNNNNNNNNNSPSNKQKHNNNNNKIDLESININKIMKNSKGLEQLHSKIASTLPLLRNIETLPTTSSDSTSTNYQHHNQYQSQQ